MKYRVKDIDGRVQKFANDGDNGLPFTVSHFYGYTVYAIFADKTEAERFAKRRGLVNGVKLVDGVWVAYTTAKGWQREVMAERKMQQILAAYKERAGIVADYFVKTDGGREAAGYKGEAGDCGPRAIALVTDQPYDLVLRELERMQRHVEKDQRASAELNLWKRLASDPSRSEEERKTWARRVKRRTPKDGDHGFSKGTSVDLVKVYMKELGWKYKTDKKRLDLKEFAHGRYLVLLSGHYTTVIDGKLYDTHDCSLNGTARVYGYWHDPRVRG